LCDSCQGDSEALAEAGFNGEYDDTGEHDDFDAWN
jgi:hypothetical protein